MVWLWHPLVVLWLSDEPQRNIAKTVHSLKILRNVLIASSTGACVVCDVCFA